VWASLSLVWSHGRSYVRALPYRHVTCTERSSADYACQSAETCTYANNKGWRYEWYTCGAIVLVMSILRVTVIRLHETPKYLVAHGRDAEVVAGLQAIASKHGRPCSLTVEQLEACGLVKGGANQRFSLAEITGHIRGLFATRKIGLSTSLVWLSWTLIGLAYPLYNVFLPGKQVFRSHESPLI
jgi:hypothetical protein